jgi:hypothetical protein
MKFSQQWLQAQTLRRRPPVAAEQRGRPNPQTGPAHPFWRCNILFLLRVFLGMQRSGTRQTLCALRQRGNGGGDEARRLVGHRLVSRAALQFKGGAPMSTIAAAAQTADRIDYWIRRHVIQYCYGTHPLSKPHQFNSARDRRVGLLAIGQYLKDQYDAFATPIPPHLTALVKQLETRR